MCKVNQEFVYCLERLSFISATFFVVDTHSKKVHYALGFAYSAIGKAAKAYQQYQRLVLLGASSMVLSQYIQNLPSQESTLVIRHTQLSARALQIAEGHVRLGCELAGEGHYDLAIEEFQSALRIYPEYQAARMLLGKAYHALSQQMLDNGNTSD